jgi:hypothetical protein
MLDRFILERSRDLALVESRRQALGTISRRALAILAGLAIVGRPIKGQAHACYGPYGTGRCSSYFEDACVGGTPCGACSSAGGLCYGGDCWSNGPSWCCDCYCNGPYYGYCACNKNSY